MSIPNEILKNLPKGIYQLVTWPDERLLIPSVECIKDDVSDLKKMIKPMIKIMEEYKGVGLAAVQIGAHKRFCVLYTGKEDPYNPGSRKLIEMINPVIKEYIGQPVKMIEGCLSLPLFKEHIDRHEQVIVEYRDINWNLQTITLEGIDAECIQHEIDHMDGKPICTKMSLTKKQIWEKKLLKARKHGKLKT